MEAEAPLIFHVAFSIVILSSVIYILRKMKASGRKIKKIMKQFLYFFLLQIPTYGLVFSSLERAAYNSGDRTFIFGLAGVIWAISILNLIGGIQLMFKPDDME